MRKAVNDLFPEDRGRKAAYVCLAFADNPEALESRLCLTTTNLSIMTSAIRSRRCIAVSGKANPRTPGDARKDRRTT
jgi:hypothetical protein